VQLVVVQKTIPFLYSVFCNENLYECSSYLHTVVLKLSDKSSKNFFEYEQQFRIEQIHLQRVSYNAFPKELVVFSCSLKIDIFFCTCCSAKNIYTNPVHTQAY